MSKQIGIDLGTGNTLIVQKEKGVILAAPSVVSIDRQTHEVIASGRSARLMIGKTPGNILAVRPLKAGVVTDPEVASLMIRDFFERLDLISTFQRPSVLVSIPHGITAVERRAVEDVMFEAGARNVALIDEPVAAAVGAGIALSKARGAMVVDLGAGVTEASVLALGGVVQAKAIRTAGNELDAAIIEYLKTRRGILIGEMTAETLKKRIGTAALGIDRGKMDVCGRNLRTGFAVCEEVSTEEICEAMREPLHEMLLMMKRTLEETPPELSADLYDFGIVMVGGGSLLPGMADAVKKRTGLRVTVAKKPLESVSAGLRRMLKSTSDFSEFVKYKVR